MQPIIIILFFNNRNLELKLHLEKKCVAKKTNKKLLFKKELICVHFFSNKDTIPYFYEAIKYYSS